MAQKVQCDPCGHIGHLYDVVGNAPGLETRGTIRGARGVKYYLGLQARLKPALHQQMDRGEPELAAFAHRTCASRSASHAEKSITGRGGDELRVRWGAFRVHEMQPQQGQQLLGSPLQLAAGVCDATRYNYPNGHRVPSGSIHKFTKLYELNCMLHKGFTCHHLL